jgi:hypothetical protein
MVNFDEDDEIISDCRKLTLSFLARQGFFKDDCMGTITWTVGGKPSGSMKVVTNVLGTDNPYVQLIYSQSNPGSNEQKNYDYKVYLDKVNSILYPDRFFYYFVCPLTSKRTSILYKPGMSEMWLHREAFKMLSSTPLQDKSFKNLEGKYGLELENKIAKLREKLKGKLKTDYKKVPVKLAERVRDLENRVNKFYVD